MCTPCLCRSLRHHPWGLPGLTFLQFPAWSRSLGRKDKSVSNLGTFLNQPWPYLTSAAFAALMLLYIHRKPHRPGVRWFGWLICVYVVWALAAAYSTVVRSMPERYNLFVLQSVCSLWATALELLVILEYTGNETWTARRLL